MVLFFISVKYFHSIYNVVVAHNLAPFSVHKLSHSRVFMNIYIILMPFVSIFLSYSYRHLIYVVI